MGVFERLIILGARVIYAFCLLLPFVVFFFVQTQPISAQNQPDWTQYNVPFPPPPPDGGGAVSSFAERANRSVEYLACGWENRFLGPVVDGGKDSTRFFDDGMLGIVMAKLWWLKLKHKECNGSYRVSGNIFYTSEFPNEGVFEQNMFLLFGGDCSSVVEKAVQTPPSPTIVQSTISGACLKAEINYVLNHLQELDTYPGTDGAACGLLRFAER
jgi:hypothetical protein